MLIQERLEGLLRVMKFELEKAAQKTSDKFEDSTISKATLLHVCDIARIFLHTRQCDRCCHEGNRYWAPNGISTCNWQPSFTLWSRPAAGKSSVPVRHVTW